jgi:glycosyltransferase involved in cell wall biosynthesis
MPTVSIVLPTYNGARYIRESIDSCLNQTYSDFELIVVDDCSTDETPLILKTYDDPRLQIIRHSQNAKLPGALNSGFSASQGDLLTWTSDDNRFHSNALEVMVEALQTRPDIGLVYSGCVIIDEFGNRVREEPVFPSEMIYEKNVVGACFLYRRAVYEEIGDYNEDIFRIEDYEYWLRIAQRFPISAIPDMLYDYRVHQGSLTSEETLVQRAKAFDDLHTRMFGYSPNRFRHTLSRLYMSRAFEEHLARRYQQVPTNVLRALYHDPAFIRNKGVWSIFIRSLLRSITSDHQSDYRSRHTA